MVSTPGHATETQIRQFARGEDRFRARRRGTRSVDPWAGKRCPAALSERAPRMKAVTCTATARSELYGQVSVGQAGYYAYRKPSSPTSRFQDGPPDSRFVYLSDVAPTAWQAVAYADIPDGGSVTVLGLGPIGDMAARIAAHLGYQVIAVDRVPERIPGSRRAHDRSQPTRRRSRERHPRHDRRLWHRLGNRRCRDGGARFAR